MMMIFRVLFNSWLSPEAESCNTEENFFSMFQFHISSGEIRKINEYKLSYATPQADEERVWFTIYSYLSMIPLM